MSVTTPSAVKPTANDAIFANPRYKTFVLAVLVLGYIFNVIDRGVLGITMPLIRQEFSFSDTQLGLLGGVAFAVFYAVLGIPIARLADRWHRVNVLALAVGLWSIATALCGATVGFYTLLLARIFTAVGEAGGTPPSHSIISDLFNLKQRATALSIYAMAVPFGTFLGNVGSGWLSEFYDWRLTFVLVGLPGLAVALLIKLAIKEPPRGFADGPAARPRPQTPPVLEVLKFLLQRRSFMHMSLAAALHAVVWYSGSQWNREFFYRGHELGQGVAGTYLGAFALIGTVGTLLGGYLADKVSEKRDDKRWYMWVPGIACAVMVPFQFVAYLHPDMLVVIPAFTVMVVLASMFFGPSFAVAQSLATVRMRAVSTSILLFIQTLIGLGLGPLVVGIISDMLEPSLAPAVPHPDDPLIGNLSLQYGMVIVGLANIWAAIHYYLGARTFREDLEETAKLNASADAPRS